MKKFSFLIGLACIISMTSCLNSDNEEPDMTIINNYVCYNNITDLSGEQSRELKAGTYVFTMDLYSLKLNLSIRGAFGDLGEVNLNINDMKLTPSTTNYSFSADAVTPEMADGVPSTHKITGLKGNIYPYVVSNESQTSLTQMIAYQISFIIDDKYKVTAIDRHPYIFSQNTRTTSADGSAFDTSDTQYEVKFSDTSKADVVIYQAQFVKEMPQISFKLQNIPVTLTEAGYVLSTESVVPVLTTNDTPFEKYTITNFSMTLSGPNMSMQFNCNPDGNNIYTTTSTGTIYPPEQESQY